MALDFLEHRTLPDPLTLSDTARQLLKVAEKLTAYVATGTLCVNVYELWYRPNAVLSAQQLLVCPTCTTDECNPIMILQDAWKAHAGSRRHRRLAARLKKGGGQGKEIQTADQPEDTHHPCA